MQIKLLYRSLPLLSAVAGSMSAIANEAEDKFVPAEPKGIYEEVLVTGGQDAIRTLSGSATFIDEESIANFDTTDLNSLLTQVPGVYIRQEDGFGLRPNIGLRGTTSERSSKITIMEDGILIGPAPYSAPAAYYIPNVNRMEALEVSKGPSAIKHGPHTVGGAINLVTRQIPKESTGQLAATLGSYGFQKYRVFYGDNFEQVGFWVDALRYGSDGFKELDGNGDTGFVRNDFNAKLQWRSDDAAAVYHEVELKIGYADEDADETYLGLTEDDFAANPLRRYAASQLDNFVSDHQQVHLLHSADFKNNWKIVSRAYVNQFERSWNKFDGILNGNDVRDVLANPSIFPQQIQLLRGEIDSNTASTQRIDITNNDRSFESSGVEVQLNYENNFGAWQHDIEVGVRYHSDWVERHHSQRGYFMQNAQLVFDNDLTRTPKALNKGETDALAFFVRDEIEFNDWIFNVGFRYESMESSFDERAPGSERSQTDSESVFMPGVGLFYNINDNFGLLFGVNKGFSAKAASAGVDVKPEESINYEYGLRYESNNSKAELIGFFSDYTNLLGRCRASDPCAGEEFNGGEVEVSGIELNATHTVDFSNGLQMPISVIYTLTDAQFGTSFISSFSQWGDFVNEGDELPYLPEHQARLQLGLNNEQWSILFALKYVDEMREIAGSGEPEADEFTEALTTMDLSVNYDLNSALSFRLVGENLADEQKVVSRRPFAARPNQPRTIKLGVSYNF